MRRFGLVVLALPALVLAGTIRLSMDFAQSDLTFEKYAGYDVVSFAGQLHTSEQGKPMLPLETYQVLIPPDAELTGVSIVSSRQEVLPGVFRLLPAQKPVPLGPERAPEFVEPDAQAYNSADPFPEQVVNTVPSGNLGGYRIAGINITPLQYTARTGNLTLSTHLELSLSYKEGRYVPTIVTDRQRALLGVEAASLVLNPDRIPAWSPQAALSTDVDQVDLLVVTAPSLAGSFQPFADWKTKKGYRTKIIGTDSIYARYPGLDNQTKIRNCITDFWQNHGLQYVVLGGDAGFVPDRKCHLTVEGATEDIPADMYYADLQYSWDSDHNGYYGEMTDSVDLFHDVYVGRVPADNVSDVATFIKKDTMFEKHPDTTYLKSLLLPSEMLFDPYHGKYANNLIAATFPPGWKISRLEDPSSNAAPESLRQGYQFCHMCCHGSYDLFGSILNSYQVAGITSGNKTSIINANSCNTGEFDDVDCIAEELVNFAGGACVATICNSRYGYGYPPAVGTSELLDLEFYRQINQRGCNELGAMNARSKDWYHGMLMNQEVWRWCSYELTLFGDPSLGVWSERPVAMDVAYSSSIPAEPQTIRASVSRAGQPLEQAQVCLMMGSTVYAVGRTNSLGWVDLFISPTTTGTMSVTVTARNCYPFEGTASIVAGSNQPALTLQSVRIDGNGRLDPGESANLVISLRNSGNAAATGVNAVLRTTSSFITLTDSLDAYGMLAAGETSPGSGYQVSVSPATPLGTEIEFYVHAIGAEGTWEPFFSTVVGTKPNTRLWADHDTGNCILSVTSFGSIGTIGPYQEGNGFKYPRNVSNGALYCASFMAGTDSGYVVDRFYGHPSSGINSDWRIVDSVHRAVPPEAGVQEYRTAFDDGNHPHPKGLTVQQWSASTKPDGYDDFVVLRYDLFNNGASLISGLYAGIMCDFDVYNIQANALKSDTARRLTYMYDPAGSGEPYVGIRLLQPTQFANLSAIRNSSYITPSSMMSEAVKDSFLRGAIRVRNSSTTANWSEVVSAGPFTVPVGSYQRVAFAFVGGMSENEVKVNSDSAQSWYGRNSGLEAPSSSASLERRLLSVEPSVGRDRFVVTYSLPGPDGFAVRVYDLSGKLVTTLRQGNEAQGRLSWEPRGIRAGVYFVRLESASGTETAKVIVQH